MMVGREISFYAYFVYEGEVIRFVKGILSRWVAKFSNCVQLHRQMNASGKRDRCVMPWVLEKH